MKFGIQEFIVAMIADSWNLPWYIKLAVGATLLYTILNIRTHVLCKLYNATQAPKKGDWSFGLFFLYETIKESKKGHYLEWIRQRMAALGLQTSSFKLAGKEVLFTHDPANIKAMLATQFNDFALGSRHKYLHITLGDGIFTLDGSGWKHSRALLRPQFSKEQVRQVESLEPLVKTLIEQIKAKNGAKFDIQPLFYKLTIDNGTDFLFGESCNSLGGGSSTTGKAKASQISPMIRQRFARAFDYVQDMLFLRVNLQAFYWLGRTKEFDRCNTLVHEFTDHYVGKALQSSRDKSGFKFDEKYVFLNELVKETRNPKVLRDQCLNILLAARDTTAGLLSFSFYALSRNPDIFQKLRTAIIESFGEGHDAELAKVSFESLKKCEYLRWFINEVLRMYPSVPRNFRVASKTTTLPCGGGDDQKSPILVEKGTPVFFFVYSLHREELYYGEDASSFRPERWGEDSARLIGWAYLPFNGGPRICLGQQLALTNASYVIVRLLQTFGNIKSFDGVYPPRLKKHLKMSLMDGANIALL